jgi:hypothetical protein
LPLGIAVEIELVLEVDERHAREPGEEPWPT